MCIMKKKINIIFFYIYLIFFYIFLYLILYYILNIINVSLCLTMFVSIPGGWKRTAHYRNREVGCVFNPFMPTGAFNICCPRDCVSRHNGGTSGAPLKPLRDDSALRALLVSFTVRGLHKSCRFTPNLRLLTQLLNILEFCHADLNFDFSSFSKTKNPRFFFL